MLGLLGALSIVTVTLSVIVIVLYGQLNGAERRIAGLEAAGRVAEVATCYVQARGRPPLIVILRGIAIKLDPDPRDATNDLVDELEAETPTIKECDMLARKRGLNPKDFPPPQITNQEGG